MPTLILSPRYTDDSVKLWRVALAQGWDVERFARWRYAEGFAPEEPVLYGEPLFCAAVADQLGLQVLAPAADFLARLHADYAQRHVWLTAARDARTLRGPVFLKPPAHKTFAARVYDAGAALPDLPDDEPVLASEPVEWLAEFRYFVLHRKVRAWSPYWLKGSLARREGKWLVDDDLALQAAGLVDRLLDDPNVALPDAVVLDAGVLRNGKAAIVEANEPSSAGLYGCWPFDVLEVLRAATVKTGHEPGALHRVHSVPRYAEARV